MRPLQNRNQCNNKPVPGSDSDKNEKQQNQMLRKSLLSFGLLIRSSSCYVNFSMFRIINLVQPKLLCYNVVGIFSFF